MKVLALVLMSMAFSLAHSTDAKAMTAATACPGHVKAVYFYRGTTRDWQRKMKLQPSRSNFNASTVHSCRYTIWVARHWQKKSWSLRRKYPAWVAAQIPKVNYNKWECIHGYEGAWNSNTGNGYYGGLQMDWGFMRTYGSEFIARWGSADNWPVWAQITAAERAYSSGRGYTPWPNTARACGLL